MNGDRLEGAIRELVAALAEELQPQQPEPDRLLSVDEAAERLGIRRVSIYRLFAEGQLRSCKVGRRRLIPASSVRELIDQS